MGGPQIVVCVRVADLDAPVPGSVRERCDGCGCWLWRTPGHVPDDEVATGRPVRAGSGALLLCTPCALHAARKAAEAP